MPTFELTDADGRVFEVSAPDQAQALAAFQQMSSGPGVGTDMAKSAGVGLAQGAIGMAGLVPDIAGMMKGAANKYLFDPLFDATIGKPAKTLTPEQQPTDANKMFGSESIKRAVEGATGDFYKPQTVAGEYARTAGEFVPNLLGGEAALGRKLLTNVLAPSAASESAGQAVRATGNDEYEGLARIVGGVGGGIAAAKVNMGAANKAAQARVPSGDDLLRKGGQQFDDVRASGATVDANDVQIIAQGIRNKILKDGADPDAHKVVFNVLDRMEAKALSGNPVPYAEIDILRKNLNGLKLNPDGAVRLHAKEATNELMDLMTRVLPQNVSGTLKEAIGNWGAGKRSNIVQGKSMLAEQNAGGTGAGANIDNTSRQAIKQLTRPMHNDIVPVAKKLGFNDEEIAAMNKIVGGTGVGNTARLVGKAAPTGSVSTATAAYTGNAVGGPIGAIALPVVGYVAKKIGDLSTKQAIAALDSLVRSRSPLAAQVAASLPQVAAQLPPKSAALLNGLTSLQSAQPTAQVKQPVY